MVHSPRILAALDADADPLADGDVENTQLRSAEAFIHANLCESFSLQDLTDAVGTSPSTLLRTFNSHLGVSPMQYVKRLRLEAVRRLLLDTDPAKGTVGDVAVRFGFHQLGRFSADYRKAYGELPSATLRKRRHSGLQEL
jgi:transcriptional regulator GlxA family with amidase domain